MARRSTAPVVERGGPAELAPELAQSRAWSVVDYAQLEAASTALRALQSAARDGHGVAKSALDKATATRDTAGLSAPGPRRTQERASTTEDEWDDWLAVVTDALRALGLVTATIRELHKAQP